MCRTHLCSLVLASAGACWLVLAYATRAGRCWLVLTGARMQAVVRAEAAYLRVPGADLMVTSLRCSVLKLLFFIRQLCVSTFFPPSHPGCYGNQAGVPTASLMDDHRRWGLRRVLGF